MLVMRVGAPGAGTGAPLAGRGGQMSGGDYNLSKRARKRMAIVALAAIAGAIAAAPPASADHGFGFSGDYVNYTVPDGVTALKVFLIGASGGDGASDPSPGSAATSGGSGAPGATVSARIPVTPGEPLRL